MRDQEGGIHLVLQDRVEQPGHVVLDVRLSRLQRQPLFHEGAERELVDEAAIDGGHRDTAALAACQDRLAERMDAVGAQERRHLDLVDDVVDEQAVRLEPDRVDARVGADPAGHLHQRLVDRRFLEVDRLRAEPLGERQAVGEMVDRDHPLGAHQERRLDREQADGAAAPHRDRVAGLDLRILGRLPAGRQDVRQEQHFVVVDAVWDHDRADVRIGDADIFGLAARIAAGHVAVAEQPRHRLAVERAADIGVVGGVGVVAAGILVLRALVAGAACDHEGHDDALTLLQRRLRADLDYLAHELVAQDVARLHRRDEPVVEVEVRSADRGRGHLDDAVARLHDLRIVDRIDANVVLSVPGQCAHQRRSCLKRRARISSAPRDIRAGCARGSGPRPSPSAA